MIDRQKLIGWLLVVVSVAYVAYFLKVRVLSAGPLIEKKEWVQLVLSVVVFMIGTANIRLAALRARRRRPQLMD